MTKWQAYWKEQLGGFYGMLMHEGQYLDPVMRNIEAFLEDSICSMMSELGRETVSAYAAAKGGLKMLTRNICSCLLYTSRCV